MDIKLIVILCSTGVVVFGILIFGVIAGIAFVRTEKGHAKSFSFMFKRGNFLRIAAVIGIVQTILFLGLLNIISENGIIGILSGIAGYVLGGLDSNKENAEIGVE